MAAPKSAVTKALKDAQEELGALDLRRQKQIANQVATIDRLLARNQELEAENASLRAELGSDR